MVELRIVPLDATAAREPPVSGNKAAVLAALLQRGYRVPRGVVISTAMVERDPSSVTRATLEALAERGIAPPWAVRSSSTAEDRKRAAYPGVFTTVLGVRTADDLHAAIEAVIGSLGGNLAQRYAPEDRLDSTELAMAVLVQHQLAPRVAGVSFSRDPVSGADHVGIEASYGLGEPLVAGRVTPDYVQVERDRAIVERTVGSKSLELVVGPASNEQRPVSMARRSTMCISDTEALEIAGLTWRVEADLGGPQDVEWAIKGNDLYVLQARPITTGGME